MRTLRLRHAAWLAASIASVISAAWSAGCAHAETSGETAAGGGATTSSGDGGSGGAGGGVGGAGGEPVPCDESKTPAEDACVLTDGLGVFVRTEGSDQNAGTKAEPVGTLGKAVELAAKRSPGKRRVYACAQDFDEAIVVPAGIELYGGLDCKTDWAAQKAKRTGIHGPADAVVVRLAAGDATTRLEDIEVVAADASVPGGSSIAVLVDGATVEIARSQIMAGAGAPGADGADAPTTPPTAAPSGASGIGACIVDTSTPGAPAMDNPLCGASIGGQGGDGGITAGGDAGNGSPDIGGGLAGAGELQMGPWSCAGGFLMLRGDGFDGEDGAAGPAGLPATGLGTLSVEGYSGPSGTNGAPGLPAQGGGGGGGTKGGATCPGKGGASGGSGGAGGCGGAGGGGGSAGGASVALVSLQGAVVLTSTTLVAGSGGDGGRGGNAQPGGAGGSGGPGGAAPATLTDACKGGTGGTGGKGGARGRRGRGPFARYRLRGQRARPAPRHADPDGRRRRGRPRGRRRHHVRRCGQSRRHARLLSSVELGAAHTSELWAALARSSRSLMVSRMITALSSIARPVTSTTGQPCLRKSWLAYSSSSRTCSRSA